MHNVVVLVVGHLPITLWTLVMFAYTIDQLRPTLVRPNLLSISNEKQNKLWQCCKREICMSALKVKVWAPSTLVATPARYKIVVIIVLWWDSSQFHMKAGDQIVRTIHWWLCKRYIINLHCLSLETLHCVSLSYHCAISFDNFLQRGRGVQAIESVAHFLSAHTERTCKRGAI